MIARSKSKDNYQRHFLNKTAMTQQHYTAQKQSHFTAQNWTLEGSRLTQLEDKMRVLNGLDAEEQNLLRDINSNNQRLESIISCIRTLMKVDPKAKRATVSPIAKAAQHRTSDRDKSSKRLIQRVEKAIHQSNMHFSK